MDQAKNVLAATSMANLNRPKSLDVVQVCRTRDMARQAFVMLAVAAASLASPAMTDISHTNVTPDTVMGRVDMESGTVSNFFDLGRGTMTNVVRGVVPGWALAGNPPVQESVQVALTLAGLGGGDAKSYADIHGEIAEVSGLIPAVPEWALAASAPSAVEFATKLIGLDGGEAKTYEDIHLEIRAALDGLPAVPDWALSPQKPTYTADEVGALQSESGLGAKIEWVVNSIYVTGGLETTSGYSAPSFADYTGGSENLPSFLAKGGWNTSSDPFVRQSALPQIPAPLTSQQTNAVNSGITAAKVEQYDGYATTKADVSSVYSTVESDEMLEEAVSNAVGIAGRQASGLIDSEANTNVVTGVVSNFLDQSTVVSVTNGALTITQGGEIKWQESFGGYEMTQVIAPTVSAPDHGMLYVGLGAGTNSLAITPPPVTKVGESRDFCLCVSCVDDVNMSFLGDLTNGMVSADASTTNKLAAGKITMLYFMEMGTNKWWFARQEVVNVTP